MQREWKRRKNPTPQIFIFNDTHKKKNASHALRHLTLAYSGEAIRCIESWCNSLVQLYVVYALKRTKHGSQFTFRLIHGLSLHTLETSILTPKSHKISFAKANMENVPYENLYPICKLFENAHRNVNILNHHEERAYVWVCVYVWIVVHARGRWKVKLQLRA